MSASTLPDLRNAWLDDPATQDAIRNSPPEDRRRALAEAARIGGEGDEGQLRAMAIYRLLQRDIDPADDALATWIVDRIVFVDPAWDEFMGACSRRARIPHVRLRGTVHVARRREIGGERGAERRAILREFASPRASDRRYHARLWYNLARVAFDQGAVSDALAASRTAAEAAAGSGEPWREMLARLPRASAFCSIDAWPEHDADIEAMRAIAESMPPVERGDALALIANHVADAAARRGDPDAVVAALNEVSMSPSLTHDPWRAPRVYTARGHALLALGARAAAEACLADARRHLQDGVGAYAETDLLEIAVLRAKGDGRNAAKVAAKLLARIAPRARPPIAPESRGDLRARSAASLAEFFESSGDATSALAARKALRGALLDEFMIVAPLDRWIADELPRHADDERAVDAHLGRVTARLAAVEAALGAPFSPETCDPDGPELPERLARLPASDRASALRAADRMRAGGGAHADRAMAVYRSLCAELPVADDDGPARARWILSRLRSADQAWAPWIERLAADAPADDLRHRGRAIRARLLEHRGEHESARAAILGLLRETSTAPADVRIRVLLNAARMTANVSEHLDALTLARAAADLAEAHAIPAARYVAAGVRLSVFLDVRDVRRARAALAEVADAAREAGWPPDDLISDALETAVVAGDRAAAADLAAEAHAAGHAAEGDHAQAMLHVHCGRASLLCGDVAAAREHVATSGAVWSLRPGVHAELALFAMEVAAAAGAPSDEPAEELCAALLRTGKTGLAPGRRAELAERAMELCAGAGVDPKWMHAFGQVAAEALVDSLQICERRNWEMACPVAPHADDLRALREFRERTADRRSPNSRIVRAVIEERVAAGAGGILRDLVMSDSALFVCAWCGRLRERSGRWLAAAPYLPHDDAVNLTHGACDECLVAVRHAAETD